MLFKPGVPYVRRSRKSGKFVLITYMLSTKFSRTGREYTTFRYYAACVWFARLSAGEFPNWPDRTA